MGLPSSLEERAARRIGSVLRGKYRIVGVLGAGGMATVYAAVHRNGGRVAIKMLHEELSLRADSRARFLREGYVANRVGHPGAVRILDDDVADDGAAFLVLELLSGETLHARARRRGGRLPWQEVLALGRQILDVLASAHAQGVVHRDIKPDNLFLTTERVLKVLDFGIARVEDELGASATATGTRMGTPTYMPPELALGRVRDIDARTDLWSTGATLFSLLSGKSVHEGESVAELAVRAATAPARSLSTVAPDAPPPVVALVDRALAFRREERWPSARAMIEAIDEAAGGQAGIEAIGPVPGSEGRPEAPSPRLPGAASTTLPRTSEASAETLPAPEVRADRSVTTQGGDADRPGTTRRGDTDWPATLPSIPPDGPVSAPPQVSAPSPWRRRLRSVSMLAAGALGLGLVLLAVRGRRPSEPTAAASAASSPPALAPGCTSSAECVTRAHGAPSICRREDGACVTLGTDDCRVLADSADVGNDATLWIGAMWPHRMPDPTHHGRTASSAVELARRDFAETSGGLPPARPGGPRRPIGVVLCDDQTSSLRSAQHLVDDLRVPAVLGFNTSKEVLDLASALFIPRGVLTVVATGAATTIRDLRPLPGEPRLVWRVTVATDALSWPFAAILEKSIEPAVRPSLRPAERMRVALLRHDSLVGQTTADSRVRELRFGGKSVAENGDAFLQVSRANFVAGGDFTEANERTARALAAFRPHVVVDMPPYPALLAAVERAWPRDALRPRYLTEGTWSDLGEGVLDWGRDGLGERVYPVDMVSSGPAALRLSLRYNEVFSPRVTPATAPGSAYDAFYLVAYGVAALGDQPVTGRALAGAIPRLLPPGEPVEVGQTGIYPALLALSAGRRIDLQGAATPLDLDPETGETTAVFALYCISAAKGGGPVRQVESGLTFDTGRHEGRGARRCP